MRRRFRGRVGVLYAYMYGWLCVGVIGGLLAKCNWEGVARVVVRRFRGTVVGWVCYILMGALWIFRIGNPK